MIDSNGYGTGWSDDFDGVTVLKYESKWTSANVGVDFKYPISKKLDIAFNTKYHWGDYEGLDEHPLRGDIAQNPSIELTGWFRGPEVKVSLDYNTDSNFTFSIFAEYSSLVTQNGDAKFFFSSGNTGEVDLYESELETKNYGVSISKAF